MAITPDDGDQTLFLEFGAGIVDDPRAPAGPPGVQGQGRSRYTLEKAVDAGEAGKDANVPQTFDEVKFEMQTGVAAAVSSSAATRFVVECLPPGLNPELEGTVPYSPSRELAVLFALLETLPNARVAQRPVAVTIFERF
ncbi:hypothetical protein JL722_4773 [Aureococcus anophagefferens]|nr:hypothetical protein JL722_4773 [Aureococcus anophagefferens]